MTRRSATGLPSMRQVLSASLGIALLFTAAPGVARRQDGPDTATTAIQSVPVAPASTYRARPAISTILSGATILDGMGGRIDGGDVAIAGGKIIAVGAALPRPEGVTVIDARGRWITPGIIDIHTHYGTYLLPQSAAESEVTDVTENSDPNVADTWVEHGVRANDPGFAYALASGVTTVQVLPGSGALFGGRSVVLKPVPASTVDAMRFPDAPQGLKMACGGNPASSFGGRGRFPNSRQGEIAGIRNAFMEAQRYAAEWRKYRDGKGSEPNRNLKLDTLVLTMDGKMPVNLHCYRSDDIANWINVLGEFGVKIAAIHHAAEAYKIAPLLAGKRICAAVWPDWWGFKREAEDGIPENAAFIDATGGCAIMHSDIPVLGSLLNIEAAKAAAAGKRAGLNMSPERAIRWITSNPAAAIGMGDRIGHIAPGMNADLVLWSDNPFSIYSKPDQVIMDGAVVVDRARPSYVPDFELGRPQREPVR